MMKKWSVWASTAVLSLIFLLGCDSGNSIPTGTVRVTVSPDIESTDDASLFVNVRETDRYASVASEFYYPLETSTVNLEVPVGTFRITVSSPLDGFVAEGSTDIEGYGSYEGVVTIEAGQITEVTARFRPETVVTVQDFTVTRYSRAFLTLRDATTSEAFTAPYIRASCRESGYENLDTSLKVENVEITNEPQNISLTYDSGFDYFTDGTVYCDFRGIDEFNRPIRVDVIN